MNVRNIFLTFILLFPVAAMSQTAGDWQKLTAYAGKHPFADISKHQMAITSVEPVRDIVKNISTAAERRLLQTYSVSPPVDTLAGDLIASYCMPHDCPAENAVLIIDPSAQNIWLGFYQYDGHAYRMQWTGTTDPNAIPSAILQKLAKDHNPF